MTATYTLLYPHDHSFNFNYYVQKHLPMGRNLFGASNLLSWKVYKLPADAPYAAQVVIEWASNEVFEASMRTENGRKWADDIKNFSKKEPLVMMHQTVVEGP
ncbi:hypothetical protein CC78DRAFT_564504 [Lojkania enalia]|uniref:Ethyl tert-butyl ether degradation EthD n=1 Tax=Lojkania enalia TaxID=147567 RepID=A0A9P4NAX7_9PLEO|nr:hypothetical protein CC78DRAFT_564504 [Didymosphaeria enalia]